MKPKIGYLVDESAGWGEPPSWTFYSEEDVPEYSRNHRKRIVYWEMDDE